MGKKKYSFYETELKSKFNFKGKEIYVVVIDEDKRVQKVDLGEERVLSGYLKKKIFPSGDILVFYPEELNENIEKIVGEASATRGQTVVPTEETAEQPNVQPEETAEQPVIQTEETAEQPVVQTEETMWETKKEDLKKTYLEQLCFNKNDKKNNEAIGSLITYYADIYLRYQESVQSQDDNENLLGKFKNIYEFKQIYETLLGEKSEQSIIKLIDNRNVASQEDIKRLDKDVCDAINGQRWVEKKKQAFQSICDIGVIIEKIAEEQKITFEEALIDYFEKKQTTINEQMEEEQSEQEENVESEGQKQEKRGRKKMKKSKKGEQNQGSLKKVTGIVSIVLVSAGIAMGTLYHAHQHKFYPDKIEDAVCKAVYKNMQVEDARIGCSDSFDKKVYLYALAKNEDENGAVSFKIGKIDVLDLDENNEDANNNKLIHLTTKQQKTIRDNLYASETTVREIKITGSTIEKDVKMNEDEDKTYYSLTTTEGGKKKTYIIGNGEIYERSKDKEEKLTYTMICYCKTDKIEESIKEELETTKEESGSELKKLEDLLQGDNLITKNEGVDEVITIDDRKYCKVGERLFVIKDDEVESNYILADSCVEGLSKKICSEIGDSAKGSTAYLYSYSINSVNNGEYTTNLDILLIDKEEKTAKLFKDVYTVIANKDFGLDKMAKCFYNDICCIDNGYIAEYNYKKDKLTQKTESSEEKTESSEEEQTKGM